MSSGILRRAQKGDFVMDSEGLAVRILIVCGPLLLVTVMYMPTLAAQFRRRLRDQLAAANRTQTALAAHLDLDGGQVSRILKFDQTAGQVTLNRLAAIALFVGDVPANLVRLTDDEPVSLTATERELLDLIRLLPEEQKGLLAKWLAFVFPERQSAQKERAMMRALNLHRQHEREREQDELRELRKRRT